MSIDKETLSSSQTLLYKSEHKKSTVSKISFGQYEGLLKNLGSEAPSESVISFNNEVAYYKLFSSESWCPELIEYGERHFVTRYLNGATVLHYYISNVSVSESESIGIARKLVDLLANFNKPALSSDRIRASRIKFAKIVGSRYKDILTSGPKGTVNTRARKLFLRLYFITSSPLLVMLSMLMPKRYLSTGNRYHGDFHMNNVIIDNEKRLWLVDYEKCMEAPLMLVDYFYATSTHLALTGHDKYVRSLYIREMTLLSESFAARLILKLFFNGIKLNPRFAYSLRSDR